MNKTQRGVIAAFEAVVSLVEMKGLVAPGHSEAVARYAGLLAEHLAVGAKELERIRLAARLHDIGYLALPRELAGREPADEFEREVKASHAEIGHDLLAQMPFLKETAQLVRHHHERFDGRGYPDNLTMDEIPLGAQIIALADYFVNSLTAAEPRSADAEAALEKLKAAAGARFNPELVVAFLAATQKEFAAGRNRYRPQFEKQIAAICDKIAESQALLPVMAKVAGRLKRMLEAEGELERVVRYVESDPGLTLKIISMANSPVFGGVERVKSVRAAVIRLGLSEVSFILNAMSSQNLFLVGQGGRLGETNERWWRESIFSGMAARVLSQAAGIKETAPAYYVGLLKGIGRPVLLLAFHRFHHLEGLTEFEFDTVLELIEAASWPVSRRIMDEAGLDGEIIELAAQAQASADPAALPVKIRVLSVADRLARMDSVVPSARALEVYYLGFRDFMASAGLDISQETFLKSLKKIWSLYRILYGREQD